MAGKLLNIDLYILEMMSINVFFIADSRDEQDIIANMGNFEYINFELGARQQTMKPRAILHHSSEVLDGPTGNTNFI